MNEEFWSRELESMRARKSYWLNNAIIRESMYRSIADENVHFLPYLQSIYFRDRSFRRGLSLCAGDGAHEILILKANFCQHLTLFDISSRNIEKFEERATKEGIDANRYTAFVENIENLHLKPNQYDVCFSISALHHVLGLERLLSEIHQSLINSGCIVLLEYVGLSRFQLAPDVVDICANILEALPASLKLNPDQKFSPPTVQQMLEWDETEAIRPMDILPLARNYFRIDMEKPYFGNLIHPLFQFLNYQRSNEQDEAFDAMINLILLFEKVLVNTGVLKTDFVLAVGTKHQP